MLTKGSTLCGLTILLTACLSTMSGTAAPAIFAPGVISTSGYESHPAFSPDGRQLLFVKSSPQFSGWKIYEAMRSGSGWSAATPVSFSGDFFDADPQFSPDGRSLYFISTRTAPDKPRKDLDIWMVRRTGTGWGMPERLPAPINSPGAEWFPRLQKDGSLYFGSDRRGGLGATDIYRAVRTPQGWQATNLGAPVNSAGDEYEFELSRDGKLGILMAARDPTTGGDLYRTARTGDGWAPPQRLGEAFNGPGLEVGPLISPDGKMLYFSSRRSDDRLGDIYVVPLAAVR
jgi:Tol biopolymer transport system component